MKIRTCECCDAEATIYCSSDSAFLCLSCDAKVHGANFLVARHLRHSIFSTAKGFPGGDSPAAGGYDALICLSSSESSVCLSSNTTPKREYSGRREATGFNCSSSGINDSSGEVSSGSNALRSKAADLRAKGIFVNWFTRLGPLGLSCDVAVRVASAALTMCLGHWTVLPFRVCLAASMWLGLRFSGLPTWQALKRLEEISGVPARLIAAAESKLERLLKAKRRQNRRQHRLVEGWGEC